MQQVLLAVHLVVALALIGLVMLQRSEGGALGMGGGGTGGFISGRGATSVLVRTTMVLAGVFIVTSVVMTRLNAQQAAAPTDIERELQRRQQGLDPLVSPAAPPAARPAAPATPDPLSPASPTPLIVPGAPATATPGLAPAPAAEKKVRLFILSGQSNMAGLNPDLSFTPAIKKEFPDDKVIVVKHAIGGRPIRLWYKDWELPAGA